MAKKKSIDGTQKSQTKDLQKSTLSFLENPHDRSADFSVAIDYHPDRPNAEKGGNERMAGIIESHIRITAAT